MEHGTCLFFPKSFCFQRDLSASMHLSLHITLFPAKLSLSSIVSFFRHFQSGKFLMLIGLPPHQHLFLFAAR